VTWTKLWWPAATINSRGKRMQIPVDLITGATLTLEVEPSDTVESVKAKIKAMSGITEDFGLAYDGKQMDEADGHRTLADYGIRDPATEMQILVSGLRGNTWTLWVEPSDTVESVKLQLQEKDGLPPCQQRLIFEGRQLDDGDTVASCGIRKHSYLNLCGRLASCDCIRTHMEAQKLIQEHH
jgi:ubiquitin C